MTRRTLLVLLAIWLGTSAPALADDTPKPPLRELDLGRRGLMFDQWFARYGYNNARSIVPERDGIRIQIPAVKDASLAGYYSHFQLAGDFEVGLRYEVISLPTPTAGYGASLGLSVESSDSTGTVGLTRGVNLQGVHEYVVVFTHPGLAPGEPARYEAWSMPTVAKTGRLVIRRERAELVCSAADGPRGELREVKRVPFTTARVRQLRLHSDCGGSPTGVAGRLSEVRATAGEIVGGYTQEELADEPSYWWWWLPVAATFGLAAWWLRARRRRGRE